MPWRFWFEARRLLLGEGRLGPLEERRAQEHVWPLTNACRSIFSLLLQATAAAEFPSLGYWGTAFC